MSVGTKHSLGGRDNAPYRIFDSHVHGYPSEVIENPSHWAESRNEGHWSHLVGSGPQGWATIDAMLATMDREGIEKVLLQAWYWENPETAELQNEWHADWVSRHPDRIMACAAVHPAMENPVEVLEKAASWGAVAVGECLPQIQDPAGWKHPGWATILDWTSSHGWPVTLHVTEPVGHEYPGRVDTPLQELISVVEAWPEQKWILAHWGGGLPFYNLNKRVSRLLKNVWFDTAASPLLYHSQIWNRVGEAVGPEKILFGSDFPLRLYPKREKDPGWVGLLKEVDASGFSADDLNRILGKNLLQLLGK